MKSIVLYGELAKRFGKYHSFAVKNAAEAIRALRANFPGFEAYMANAHKSGVGFRMFVGRGAIEEYGEVHNPAGKAEVIRLVPVIMGSKSPWVRILIGAALVAVALTVPGLGPAALSIGLLGGSMILGGVAQLLTKTPEQPGYQEQEERESYLFNGPVNTSVQGAAVSLVYGRMIVGSKVISAGIEAYEEPA